MYTNRLIETGGPTTRWARLASNLECVVRGLRSILICIYLACTIPTRSPFRHRAVLSFKHSKSVYRQRPIRSCTNRVIGVQRLCNIYIYIIVIDGESDMGLPRVRFTYFNRLMRVNIFLQRKQTKFKRHYPTPCCVPYNT